MQMQEPSAFSQHQAMERDDTGIVAPSNTFHQPLPTNFMDFPKVHPLQSQSLIQNVSALNLCLILKRKEKNSFLLCGF